MAAGRHNISRKRYSDRCQEEYHQYKNGYNQKSSSSGRGPLNTENNRSSGGRNHDHKRNGYDEGPVERESYGGSRPVDRGRRKEVSFSEDGSRIGSERKRKFSPIVWDRDEKKLRVSSKNTVRTTCCRSSPPKLSKTFGQLSDIAVEVKTDRCSVADDQQQISPVESLVSNVSDGMVVSNSLAVSTPFTSPEQHTEDDQELEKMEEGEYVEERNLSKSKWAFENSPSLVSDVNNSSPESGEFKQEGSDRIRDVASMSAEGRHFKAAAIEDDHSEDNSFMVNVDDKVSCYFSSEDEEENCLRTEAAEVSKSSGLDMMQCCRNVFEYERLGKISEGTYGVVYKARDKKTGDIVALKKVKIGKEREGFPVTALREINILGSFHHPSIVEVKEVVMDDFDGVYMVMEYIDHELKGYMESMKQPFSQSEVKCLIIQLLEGLSYLHDNWVIHRDLKTSNLLLNNKGELKICDFGMSRQYGSPVKPYTPLVVTLWYRAPEVLLGMKQYTTAIDMWSVGCIMGELLAKKPLFDGNRELEQIDKIFRTLGTPNELIWPGYSKLPGVKPNFVKQPYNGLRKKFPVATFTGSPVLTEMGFDLLNKLLTYDPKKRITAEEALNHGWFREAPLPAEHVGL